MILLQVPDPVVRGPWGSWEPRDRDLTELPHMISILIIVDSGSALVLLVSPEEDSSESSLLSVSSVKGSWSASLRATDGVSQPSESSQEVLEPSLVPLPVPLKGPPASVVVLGHLDMVGSGVDRLLGLFVLFLEVSDSLSQSSDQSFEGSDSPSESTVETSLSLVGLSEVVMPLSGSSEESSKSSEKILQSSVLSSVSRPVEPRSLSEPQDDEVEDNNLSSEPLVVVVRAFAASIEPFEEPSEPPDVVAESLVLSLEPVALRLPVLFDLLEKLLEVADLISSLLPVASLLWGSPLNVELGAGVFLGPANSESRVVVAVAVVHQTLGDSLDPLLGDLVRDLGSLLGLRLLWLGLLGVLVLRELHVPNNPEPPAHLPVFEAEGVLGVVEAGSEDVDTEVSPLGVLIHRGSPVAELR